MDYSEKKKLPKKAKSKLNEIETTWWRHRDYMFELPWWITLFLGLTGELAYLGIFDYGILIITLFIFATLFTFRILREKQNIPLGAAVFICFTCILASPFSAGGFRQPEFLASTLSFSLPNAKEATAMLFLYNQAALIYSTAMLMAYTWKLGLLRTNKLDGRAFALIVNNVITNNHEAEDFEKIQNINQDIPIIVQSFSQGNSALTISLGWSTILRGLDVLVKKKVNPNTPEITPYKQAEEAGINTKLFSDGKRMRNEFSHGHYTPKLSDSLNTLKTLKEILEKLSIRKLEKPRI
jgi:hypothetical protein